jgi:hypothetical protein
MLNSDSAGTWFRRLGPWECFSQLTHEVAFGRTIVCAIVELFGAIDARILQESAEIEAAKPSPQLPCLHRNDIMQA